MTSFVPTSAAPALTSYSAEALESLRASQKYKAQALAGRQPGLGEESDVEEGQGPIIVSGMEVEEYEEKEGEDREGVDGGGGQRSRLLAARTAELRNERGLGDAEAWGGCKGFGSGFIPLAAAEFIGGGGAPGGAGSGAARWRGSVREDEDEEVRKWEEGMLRRGGASLEGTLRDSLMEGSAGLAPLRRGSGGAVGAAPPSEAQAVAALNSALHSFQALTLSSRERVKELGSSTERNAEEAKETGASLGSFQARQAAAASAFDFFQGLRATVAATGALLSSKAALVHEVEAARRGVWNEARRDRRLRRLWDAADCCCSAAAAAEQQRAAAAGPAPGESASRALDRASRWASVSAPFSTAFDLLCSGSAPLVPQLTALLAPACDSQEEGLALRAASSTIVQAAALIFADARVELRDSTALLEALGKWRAGRQQQPAAPFSSSTIPWESLEEALGVYARVGLAAWWPLSPLGARPVGSLAGLEAAQWFTGTWDFCEEGEKLEQGQGKQQQGSLERDLVPRLVSAHVGAYLEDALEQGGCDGTSPLCSSLAAECVRELLLFNPPAARLARIYDLAVACLCEGASECFEGGGVAISAGGGAGLEEEGCRAVLLRLARVGGLGAWRGVLPESHVREVVAALLQPVKAGVLEALAAATVGVGSGRALAQLGGILAGIALAGDSVGFSGRAMLAAGGLEALAGRALGMCTAAVGNSPPQAWAPVLREALAQHI